MYDIVTIGSATQDTFLRSKIFELVKTKKDTLQCFPFGKKIGLDQLIFDTGGGGTNTVVTLKRLGLRSAVITATGNDDAGRNILRALHKEKITTKFIQCQTSAVTDYSIILTAGSAERTILTYRGASKKIAIKKIPWSELKTKWLYIAPLSGQWQLWKRLIEFSKRKNIKIAWNPGRTELNWGIKKLQKYLPLINILILNRYEASVLTRTPIADTNRLLKKLASLTKQIVVMTDGAKGAYVCAANRRYFAPALKEKKVNVTGAGDAFGSAFVAGMILWQDPIDSLRLAILNSGKVVQEIGAKRGLLLTRPSRASLYKIPVRVSAL